MRTLLLIVLCTLCIACDQDSKHDQSFDVTIRLDRDPGQINPFYATTSIGREVYQYIFTPLADFHPDDLELYPILVEKLPEAVDTLLDGQDYVAYDINIKDDAKWSDGRAITARDYFFTIQMIKHPDSEISAWKPYFESLKALEIHPQDETRVKVFFDPDYMLSREVALTTFIMPAHIFDKEGILSGDGRKLIDASYTTTDSLEKFLVEEVNASVNDKTAVVQSGPYTLSDYQTDEYIVLTAKEDYWGSAYSDNVFLKQYPENIIFRIVPDEVTAINMAKESALDFIKFRSSERFLELREDSIFSKNWNFFTPQIMLYYFIAMNNKKGPLSDKKVRQAMSYLADVDDYIQNIDGGLGSRTIGHFNPSKPYYNNSIEPTPFDPEKANSLLEESGWTDGNGDGVREKRIAGKTVILELDFYITGSELSQKIALLLKEEAAKSGVRINIVSKSMSLMRQENLSTFNYDLAALARGTDASPDDPYSSWHSDNAIPGTGNQTGYSNPKADEYIDEIRSNRSSEGRKQAYLRLQEVMHEDQPAIFLYAPLQKIAISKRLDASTTAKRPGYFANSFKLAKE